MPRQAVGNVIHHLLTDEDLRVRFALEPNDTMAELICRGFDLAAEEIEIFVRTDPGLWFWSSALFGHRAH
jgi:hypothetical protein